MSDFDNEEPIGKFDDVLRSDYDTETPIRMFREDLEKSGHSALEKTISVSGRDWGITDDMAELLRQQRVEFFGAAVDCIPPGKDWHIRTDAKMVKTLPGRSVSGVELPDVWDVYLRIEVCNDPEVWQELKSRRDRYTHSRLDWNRFVALDDALHSPHIDDD